jgi:hypothetical protein
VSLIAYHLFSSSFIQFVVASLMTLLAIFNLFLVNTDDTYLGVNFSVMHVLLNKIFLSA